MDKATILRAVMCGLVLAGGGSPALHAQDAAKAETAQVQFNGTDVRVVFEAVVKKKGISYVLCDDVKGVVTGSFDLAAPDVFVKIAEAAGCAVDEFPKSQFLIVHAKEWKMWAGLKDELDALPEPSKRQVAKLRKLVFQSAPLRDVLAAGAESDGKALSIPDDIKGTVTARMVDVPLVDAMQILLGMEGYSLSERDGKWVIEKGKIVIEGGAGAESKGK